MLEATGPFYAEYKLRPLRPLPAILANQDRLFARIFEQARVGRTWHILDLEQAAEALRRPRSQIAALLADLEIEGLVEIKAAGARQGYRLLPGDHDVEWLGSVLATRFELREERDIDRIHYVLDFVKAECFTRSMLEYFGEWLDGPCGHCARCLGVQVEPMPAPPVRALGRAERAKVVALRAEDHEALATPRQLARFLCGLSSPATSRARLTRHALFGALADVPFANVLALAQGRGRRNVMQFP